MPVRTTTVGSWWTLEEHADDLRRYHRGELGAEDGAGVVQRAARAAVDEQRELGLDGWTGGEYSTTTSSTTCSAWSAAGRWSGPTRRTSSTTTTSPCAASTASSPPLTASATSWAGPVGHPAQRAVDPDPRAPGGCHRRGQPRVLPLQRVPRARGLHRAAGPDGAGRRHRRRGRLRHRVAAQDPRATRPTEPGRWARSGCGSRPRAASAATRRDVPVLRAEVEHMVEAAQTL
jgi:HAMP domain-containing protein